MKKINGIKIASLTAKIIFIFTLFLLISNFSSHYISLMLNRDKMVSLLKTLLVKDLKSAYRAANSQYQIYQFKKDLKGSVKSFERKALSDFTKEKSVMLGVKPNKELLFQASKIQKYSRFQDDKVFNELIRNHEKNINEGFISFSFNNSNYFAVYKYNAKWDVYLIRGEELKEFYKDSQEVFIQVSFYIVAIVVLCVIVGIFLIRYILRFVGIISSAILKMVQSQEMEMIDVSKGSGDQITFLGVAFNSLSNTIGTLLDIFRKFTNKDIVIKAYKEKTINLEGSKKDLTCLFSDIKSFTNMTEVLGTDIITLLNMHYHEAIRAILDEEGIIGSIIGDALLAVYGVFEEEASANKSYQAVKSAYKIHEVAKKIRDKMQTIKEKLIEKNGELSEREQKVYQAVLIEVGVGIDGGMVFYGNIGSNDRMTNTVIGDNVNSSSRLEGLTRIYKVPVICSEYVMDDIKENQKEHGLLFFELDQVQVKGKTIGKKVYWPVFENELDEQTKKDLEYFEQALPLYYEGKWEKAHELFSKCSFELAEVFIERTASLKAPSGWNGIWAMTTK